MRVCVKPPSVARSEPAWLGRWRRNVLVLSGMALFSSGLWAQATTESYPSRALKIVVPFGPGSGTDTATRMLAQRLEASSSNRWWWKTDRAPMGRSPALR